MIGVDRPQRGHNILAHGSAVGVWALAGYHVKSLVDAIDYFPDAGYL
jgi:hypothetical protein